MSVKTFLQIIKGNINPLFIYMPDIFLISYVIIRQSNELYVGVITTLPIKKLRHKY